MITESPPKLRDAKYVLSSLEQRLGKQLKENCIYNFNDELYTFMKGKFYKTTIHNNRVTIGYILNSAIMDGYKLEEY